MLDVFDLERLVDFPEDCRFHARSHLFSCVFNQSIEFAKPMSGLLLSAVQGRFEGTSIWY
jgi:hypothetical protein